MVFLGDTHKSSVWKKEAGSADDICLLIVVWNSEETGAAS